MLDINYHPEGWSYEPETPFDFADEWMADDGMPPPPVGGWFPMPFTIAREAAERGWSPEAMMHDARDRLALAAGQWSTVDPFTIASDPQFGRADVIAAAKLGSPIEQMLLEALIEVAGHIARPAAAGAIATLNGLSLYSQLRIGGYSADLALHDPATRRGVVIEADGHAYHDRTVAQASRDRRRDRFMQARGWLVARFTGTDIHRDALACATEALELAQARD